MLNDLDFSMGSRIFYLVTSLLMIGVLAWYFAFSGSEDPPSGYAAAGADTVHTTDVEASRYFNITEEGVAPASLTVELNETVGFRNRLDESITLTFDRSDDAVSINSGGSKTLLINGITYFQVEGSDYSGRGRVNVQ